VELAGEDALLLGLLASGLMIGAVARRMHLSERTVRRRLRSLCDQLDVATPVEAVVWAVRAGVL
jgi:DNA-binding NarL/FixJ family response regulator